MYIFATIFNFSEIKGSIATFELLKSYVLTNLYQTTK
ncbi:hypothetical protein BD809_102434 [Aquimarina intermedia]|uniref:Uncharacterized protein n=1 Tax=Aquimarina intermedia TaxID=350814 RepID=A0A5S5CD12_9FLAO|nr:hypothetical protein BD809_102434 [Aquimarina intermedia]